MTEKLTRIAFKEKLLIYHAGHGRVNWLSLLRVAAIVGFSAVTFIVVPAHVTYGTDWTTIAFSMLLLKESQMFKY